MLKIKKKLLINRGKPTEQLAKSFRRLNFNSPCILIMTQDKTKNVFTLTKTLFLRCSKAILSIKFLVLDVNRAMSGKQPDIYNSTLGSMLGVGNKGPLKSHFTDSGISPTGLSL